MHPARLLAVAALGAVSLVSFSAPTHATAPPGPAPFAAVPETAAGALLRTRTIRSGLVDIDVELRGRPDLWLVVTDGGDGHGCDWADWVAPRLEGPAGVLRLTDLEWSRATAGWGQVRKNRNAAGGPLRVGGEEIAWGIGTHANSAIRYEIPAGFSRFRARVGLDNGGTDQGCGSSVAFLVFDTEPPRHLLRSTAPGGGPLTPDQSLELLETADGLEATLFASEPMVVNPTNMDIDARGRIWVTEGVNYRRWKDNRPGGDRIVILEDTDLDGRADRSSVFYQDPEINSALGICVLGERVIVSVSPHVFVFTDTDGDDRPERKEILFSGIGGVQHDHGVHAFVFGPDGKLYFNFGNNGGQLRDASGKIVVDLAGNEVRGNGQPYRQGMVFRLNLDGSELETVGHNFRNNFEVCADSFGTLWQSDNDDDGNRGVRVNYVMEYGNFGYTDERTGAGWRSPRTGMHEEIPKRHWHQNDPGVVPNFVQTGAGSPTGICVYEGRLLPAVFHDELLHCDAGPNVVRCYPARARGAGYEGDIVEIVHGSDRWFRPSDICVAPDGSVYIADWYDAGVGGHNMADNDPEEVRGRIYRIAPPGHRPFVPVLDLSSPSGACESLQSPNQATRHLAWRALRSMGEAAGSALLELWREGAPRMRARALALLARLDSSAETVLSEGLRDPHPDIRGAALRTARAVGFDVIPMVRRLVDDLSPRVRRECTIALRHQTSPEMPGLWARLAMRHESGDRWYVEALGIGADGREGECFRAWLLRVGAAWNTPAGREIIWRSRAPDSARYLAEILHDPETPAEELPRYLRALDFLEGEPRERALVSLLVSENELLASEALARLKTFDPDKNDDHREVLESLLESSRGTARYVSLVERFGQRDRRCANGLLQTLGAHPTDSVGARAAHLLLEIGAMEALTDILESDDGPLALKLTIALGNANDRRAVPLLASLVRGEDTEPNLAAQAVRALAHTRSGADTLLGIEAANALPEELRPVAALALSNVVWAEVRAEARRRLPLPAARDDTPLPPIPALVALEGNATAGARVFETHCQICHRAGSRGVDFAPALTEIGDKLGKDALFLSILDPNAGISFDYEGELLILRSTDEVVGIVTSETADTITLKSQGGIVGTYAKSDILIRRKLRTSIMPTDLQRNMTRQDLVDLVEFLSGLRRSSAGN